jgi:hypothetical protein
MRLSLALLPCPVIAAVMIACFSAPQTIVGGDAQFDAYLDTPQDDSGDASDASEAGPVCDFTTDAGDATWSSLYANLFGPSGIGQCGDATRSDGTSTTSCHQDGSGNGAISSGFICGLTQESCYQGITSSMANYEGSQVVVAGDPGGSFLVKIMRSCSGGIMPFLPQSVVFSNDQMSSVSTWIAAGALDN